MTTDIINTSKVYTKTFKRNFNELELKILSILSDGSKTLDEVSKIMQRKPFEIIECITILEIEGTVKNLPGGRYTIS
jgi:predicted transcriptional regulator